MKNFSEADKALLVQALSDEKFRLLIPAIVYLALLMVFGFIGNAMVFYYYWFKARVNTYTIFISLLSIYDLLVCTLAMPLEISRNVHFYTFDSGTICKILRFSNYFASMGSILTLIAIAADRYRRICRWSATQLSVRLAKIICLVTAVIGAALSWPTFVVYGTQKVSIPNNYGVVLHGYMCTGSWEASIKPYVSAFYSFMFGLLIVCAVILAFLYTVIGIRIYLHKKRLAGHKSNTSNLSKEVTGISTEQEVSRDIYVIDSSSEGVIQNRSVRRKPAVKTDDSGKLTLMLVTITVLFVISYFPLFAVLIWRQTVGKHQIQFLSGSGLLAFEIATTSFLISSAVNPWVYGFFCFEFRHYIIKRFAKLSGRDVSSSQL